MERKWSATRANLLSFFFCHPKVFVPSVCYNVGRRPPKLNKNGYTCTKSRLLRACAVALVRATARQWHLADVCFPYKVNPTHRHPVVLPVTLTTILIPHSCDNESPALTCASSFISPPRQGSPSMEQVYHGHQTGSLWSTTPSIGLVLAFSADMSVRKILLQAGQASRPWPQQLPHCVIDLRA